MNSLPGLYLPPEWLQYSDGLAYNYWEEWDTQTCWKRWQGDQPDSDSPLRRDTNSFELPQEYLL